MGCGSSKVFVVNDKYPGQDQKTVDDLMLLGFSMDDINRLYTAFRSFDFDNSGEVNLLEFLVRLNIEETIITKEVFSEFDNSHDKTMTFREFALNMWNFCTLDKSKVAEFAFDIYDTDDSQTLSQDELIDMVHAVYGERGASENALRILRKMDKSRNNLISRKEFGDFAKSFPALLFPAFAIQTALQTAVCGEDFWMRRVAQAVSVRKMEEVKKIFQHKRKAVVKKGNHKRTESTSAKEENPENEEDDLAMTEGLNSGDAESDKPTQKQQQQPQQRRQSSQQSSQSRIPTTNTSSKGHRNTIAAIKTTNQTTGQGGKYEVIPTIAPMAAQAPY